MADAFDDTAPGPIDLEIDTALDAVKLEEIAGYAALCSSFWKSIELAADRGNTLTVVTHARQVAHVTGTAFAIIKSLGSAEIEP